MLGEDYRPGPSLPLHVQPLKLQFGEMLELYAGGERAAHLDPSQFNKARSAMVFQHSVADRAARIGKRGPFCADALAPSRLWLCANLPWSQAILSIWIAVVDA